MLVVVRPHAAKCGGPGDDVAVGAEDLGAGAVGREEARPSGEWDRVREGPSRTTGRTSTTSTRSSPDPWVGLVKATGTDDAEPLRKARSLIQVQAPQLIPAAFCSATDRAAAFGPHSDCPTNSGNDRASRSLAGSRMAVNGPRGTESPAVVVSTVPEVRVVRAGSRMRVAWPPSMISFLAVMSHGPTPSPQVREVRQDRMAEPGEA